MNFKHISHWKVCNKTFQNLDLKSLKIVLKPDQSFIWKILEFGTNVLSSIRRSFLRKQCVQSDLQRIWQILRNWFCWRQMLHFDKRWLISLWYRQKPCIVGSIEMMVQQVRKGLWAWLLMLFIVLLEERRIINGYQRCTFDNEITNFSSSSSTKRRFPLVL